MAEEQVQVPAEEVTASAVPIAPVEFNVESAVEQVIQKAMIQDGLRRGIREAVRALDRRTARVCFLAQNCDEKAYVNLVRALCKENDIPLVTVDDGKQLGGWCGLVRTDAEGAVKKTIRCSCAVVTDFGEDTDALRWLLDHVKSQSA